jgi:hypothetical protein
MTIKTLVAVALAISIIIVLFTITRLRRQAISWRGRAPYLSAAALPTIRVLEQALPVTGEANYAEGRQ